MTGWIPQVGTAAGMLYDVPMLPYMSDDFDTRITTWLVNHWGRNITCDAFFSVVSEWTPIIMMGVISLAAFGFAIPASKVNLPVHAGVSAVVTAVAARIINQPVGALFHRDRPFRFLGFVPLVHHDASHSFPSNHATGAFALAVAMTAVPGYYGPLMIGLAVALAICRVYVGLHYASDVVVGAIHGTVVATLVIALSRWLHIYGHIGAS